MWKCRCCGMPRFHAGRTSSRHHDPTPKPQPETLKSPNRGVCMWKCPCCGVPRSHAERTASRPHPETPARNLETPPRMPTPKPRPETLKSPNRGVCMWKCPCCGVPRFHAGRMSSGPHPETPKPYPETPPTPPRNPTPKPWSLQIEECACGSVLAVACHLPCGAHVITTPPRNPECSMCKSWRKSGRMCKWRSRIACMCKWRMHV